MFSKDIPENVKKEHLNSRDFAEDVALQNVRRGRPLAFIVIAFESVLLLTDIATAILEVSNTFSFFSYLGMYALMISMNLAYLLLIPRFSRDEIQLKAINVLTVVYLTLVMVWGGVISLMDQRLYGHLMAFMVNMMVCSIIYIADAKKMSVPFLTSALILSIGLPFFQNSGNVLIGHYVNLAVFVIISWTASRIIYRNYCDNYLIKVLMDQANRLLEKKMEENRAMNEKLAVTNAQLKNLALADDLTGLPNRRSFREFIERMFQAPDTDLTMTVVMIDIDGFKLYNDFYGHDNGDMTLIAVAKEIESMVQNADQMAVRWGGEEFIYVAFQKGRDEALRIAESIRLKVLDLKIPNRSSEISPYVTISLGVCNGKLKSIKEVSGIMQAADRAMYQAKNGGKNRVSASDWSESAG
jgi:diguanylate cyclase (GGDEF)-like protein